MGGGAARRGRSRTVEREVELAGHPRVLAEDVQQQLVAVELFRARRHAVLDRGALFADLGGANRTRSSQSYGTTLDVHASRCKRKIWGEFLSYGALGDIGTNFKELAKTTQFVFERAVPMSPNAW